MAVAHNAGSYLGRLVLFQPDALEDLPPLTIVLGRVGLAALALHLMLRLSGERLPRDRRAWGAFVVMGALANLIPFGLIVWGQTRIESGLASILNATVPLFTLLVAHQMTRDEKLAISRLVGVVIGFAGVVIVIGPSSLMGLGGDAALLAAQLAVLTAALSYAVASVYGRRFQGLSPLAAATGQVTASSLLLLPIVLLVDRPWEMGLPGPAAAGAVGGLALLCTGVAYILYFRILATAGATNLALVTFLIPISALLLGMTLLGERLEPHHWGGMTVIFVGLAAVNGRLAAAAAGLVARRMAAARSSV